MYWLIAVGVAAVGAIWILNGICIIQGIRTHITSQVLSHTGLAVFFSLPTIEFTFGIAYPWHHYWADLVQIPGFVLYGLGIYLVASSFHALATQGRAKGKDFTTTTKLMQTGIYGIVRHPMMLGVALWSVGMMLVFRSLISLFMGSICVALFFLASVLETKHNAMKFGQAYRDYSARVPMWNLFARLWRARGRHM